MTWKDHLDEIIEAVTHAMTIKYEAGQLEHGGRLWMKGGALRNLEDELTDAPTYFYTAKQQLWQMAEDGKSARDAYDFLFGPE